MWELNEVIYEALHTVLAYNTFLMKVDSCFYHHTLKKKEKPESLVFWLVAAIVSKWDFSGNPVNPPGTLSAVLLIYCRLGCSGTGTNHHHNLATQQPGLHIEPCFSRHSCSAQTPGSSFQSQPGLFSLILLSLALQEQLNSLLFSVHLHFISEATEVACHSVVRFTLLTTTLLRISNPGLAAGGLSKHCAFIILSFPSLPVLTQYCCLCC